MDIFHSAVHVENIMTLDHPPTSIHPNEVKLEQLLAHKDSLQLIRPN